MTIAEMVKAEVMKLIGAGEAPVIAKPAVPPAVKKRTLSPEHLAKMQAGRKRKADAKAAPVEKPKPAAKAAPAAKPAKTASIDAVGGVRVVAEPHTSAEGRKSILVGTKGKHARLVFHSRDELVEFINDLRKAVGGDVAALADLHFGG